MDRDDALLAACETHDVDALQAVFAEGPDATAPVRGKLPLQWLLEMYLRSQRFPACLQVLLRAGARLDDAALAAVLLDDAQALTDALRADPLARDRRHDLVSAFTSLRGASLLHAAAEYGNAAAARTLLAAGADVEARAAADAAGSAGHTPLFHTVASILDHGAPVMHLLLAAGARTDVRLPSLTWGEGFEWETTLFDVTPISYCQAGLLPQMHRDPAQVYRNLEHLFAAAGRPWVPPRNVPNRYLQPRRG
jgi:hypothetical protein